MLSFQTSLLLLELHINGILMKSTNKVVEGFIEVSESLLKKFSVSCFAHLSHKRTAVEEVDDVFVATKDAGIFFENLISYEFDKRVGLI